ncbi:MAG: hypothetical protein N3C13_04695 [Aquificaceae bacterium]|nr:hypothetical protein [Aquificaceae bacterium]MCX8060478.1 hypothetical protein [Aquificaceae bacterium]
MLRKVVTATEGEKSFSVEYSPLSREWKPTSKKGKTLCVVPSDRCLVKLETLRGDRKTLLERLKTYAQERFPDSRHQLKVFQDRVYLALYRGSEGCESSELEPFALARLYSLHAEEGLVIDWGRRKTVFVRVKDGLFESFRVVLRGGDYVSQRLAQSRGVEPEEAERLKRSEGMNLREVREAVEEILELSGYELKERVLLTGGGSRLVGLESLFDQRVELLHCEPEQAVCLGACLREVLKNPYPDFQSDELTPAQMRRLAYAGGALGLASALSLFYMQELYSVEELREVQRAEFKKLFPKEPVVSLHQQVKSKVSAGESYKVTRLFLQAQESLKPGMKLYSFEYAEGRLTVKGEADRSLLQDLKLHSTKETPTGRVEFELRVP